MKLFFLTGSLPHGGAERQTITLADRLAERGHECHFAYVKDNPGQLQRLRGAASVRCLHARRYLDWRALATLRAELARLRPDAVVAANPYALMYARLGLRRLAIPLAVTFHSTRLVRAKEWLQMLYYRPFFWSAERTIFVCEAQREYWARRRLGGKTNVVIHNGVNLEHWRPGTPQEKATMRRVLGFADDDFVIGMSAVLRPEKNPVQLVQAVARLRRQAGLPARALLIGDGEMRAAVEARARSLGIEQAVTITGLKQEVRSLVLACDALALCSTSETFSLAALEAMALERPVVHSQVGGAAEMITPGRDGYLFPVGDTAALVERLTALAERSACRRMGARARETVEMRFSERSMVERYETTLTEITTTRRNHDNVRNAAGAH